MICHISCDSFYFSYKTLEIWVLFLLLGFDIFDNFFVFPVSTNTRDCGVSLEWCLYSFHFRLLCHLYFMMHHVTYEKVMLIISWLSRCDFLCFISHLLSSILYLISLSGSFSISLYFLNRISLVVFFNHLLSPSQAAVSKKVVFASVTFCTCLWVYLCACLVSLFV